MTFQEIPNPEDENFESKKLRTRSLFEIFRNRGSQRF